MLPFVDSHAIHVDAGAERVAEAMRFVALKLAKKPAPRPFIALWRLEPEAGFAVKEATDQRFVLAGRHRFSSYELVFEVAADGDGATLRALTYAEFPGAPGRLYRAAVIGTGGHGIAVRSMLSKIRRRAEAS